MTPRGAAKLPPRAAALSPGDGQPRPTAAAAAVAALTAAERIRAAQQRWQAADVDDEQQGADEDGDSEGDEGEEGEEREVSVLTDEGDPDAEQQQGRPQQGGASSGDEGGGDVEGRRRQQRSAAAQHRSPGWQRRVGR